MRWKSEQARERETQAARRLIADVQGAFCRVLKRDPSIEVSDDISFFVKKIKRGDYVYDFHVGLGKTNIEVSVSKERTNDDFELSTAFFRYSCPKDKPGKLRKTALILLKKIQMREVYEVMVS